MKKIISILVILTLFQANAFIFKKKEKPVLILSAKNPLVTENFDEKIAENSVFKINSRIYFLVYLPDGFKSNYIRYQIVKQDDNAHEGGYSRVRAKNVRIKDKHTYSDYFTLSQTGKYYIQIFDIENLHQWRAFGGFRVVEE